MGLTCSCDHTIEASQYGLIVHARCDLSRAARSVSADALAIPIYEQPGSDGIQILLLLQHHQALLQCSPLTHGAAEMLGCNSGSQQQLPVILNDF